MKETLANIQSDEQKQSNDIARYHFIIAMMGMDDKMINLLLKSDSTFLGYMNKWQFLHWLKSKFDRLKGHNTNAQFNEGISLDYYPGADVLEFYFASLDEEHEYKIINNSDEEGFFFGKLGFKLSLVLLFEDGKISDVRVSRKYIYSELSNRFKGRN
jgi:hypothetical protein